MHLSVSDTDALYGCSKAGVVAVLANQCSGKVQNARELGHCGTASGCMAQRGRRGLVSDSLNVKSKQRSEICVHEGTVHRKYWE